MEKNCFNKIIERKADDPLTSRFVEAEPEKEEFLKSYELPIMGDESAISFISDSFSNQYLPKSHELLPIIKPGHGGNESVP